MRSEVTELQLSTHANGSHKSNKVIET